VRGYAHVDLLVIDEASRVPDDPYLDHVWVGRLRPLLIQQSRLRQAGLEK
jgi:hypothetical protein